jgi:AraC-like DNA-binding protein
VHLILPENGIVFPSIDLNVFLCDQSMAIPSELAVSWRNCGLYVRGVWLHRGLPHRSSTHGELWQVCVVQRGRLHCLGALGEHHLETGDLILSAPGHTMGWRPSTEVDLLEVIFSAIPEPGHPVPWTRLRLPAIIHGVEATGLIGLADQMIDTRWRDDEAAMEARFAVDRFLWQVIGHGFANGDLEGHHQRPQWLQDIITAVDAQLAEPTFDVHGLVRLAGCSHAHLCRSIKRYEGCSPSALIRRLRVARAAHILSHEPETEVTTLVQRCGFGSAERFRRQWRAESPRGLRVARGRTQPAAGAN